MGEEEEEEEGEKDRTKIGEERDPRIPVKRKRRGAKTQQELLEKSQKITRATGEIAGIGEGERKGNGKRGRGQK